MRILIATNNAGKRQEFRAMLGDGVEIVSMREVGLPSPPESGDTFEENAVAKARYASEATGLLTVADDSGLEVDALGGAPGVYSARYAGEGAADTGNRSLLLRRLEGVPPAKRSARFVSVVAVCMAGEQCRSFRGVWEGRIGSTERGKNGFGYDALFELPDGRTAAELPPDEKNAQSHRAKALSEALPYLRTLMNRSDDTQVKGES